MNVRTVDVELFHRISKELVEFILLESSTTQSNFTAAIFQAKNVNLVAQAKDFFLEALQKSIPLKAAFKGNK